MRVRLVRMQISPQIEPAVLMPFGCTGHGKLSPQRLGEDYRYQAACMR